MGKNHLLGDPFTDEERVPFALVSFLFEGPGGKRAIVDFGPKDPAYFNECFRRYGLFRERCGDKEHPDDVIQPEGNVLDHLGRLGIGTGSIDHIIFTHLHYDHVGGSRPPDAGLLWDFPGALIHVSRRGWEDNLARRADGWRWTSYVDFEISQEIFVRGNEGRARMADEEEILPGLRTRYLGGHSVCSQAVLVDTAEGTAVIAGDVVYRYEYLAEGIVARLRTTPEEYAEAVVRVVRLVEESGGVLVPVHDPKILEAWRKAGPGWLAELRPESDRALRAFRDRGGGGALRILEAHRNKG
jgi:glyoxylase-like metal-dependent hydrolase (beta-lactamase superfamily II)